MKKNSSSDIVLQNNIHLYRRMYNWTQEELGKRLGIDRLYVRRLERNEYMPRVTLLYKIAEVFNIPVQEVFFRPDERPPIRFDSEYLGGGAVVRPEGGNV